MTDLELMTSGDLGDDSRRSPRPWGYAEDLGRYWLPDPADELSWEPGSIGARHMPRGYMRTSNLIGAYSDTRALSIWEQGKLMRGLAARPDLYADLCTAERDDRGDLRYSDARRIAGTAMKYGGADAAAELGTAQHRVMEQRLMTGRLIGTPEMQEAQLRLEALLKEHLLQPVPEYAERIVVNTHLRVAGRFDVALKDMQSRRLLMGDLKTKRKAFWGVLEQRAQFAVYARADALWDEGKQCYVSPPAFDLDEGILMHLPQDQWGTEAELRAEPQLLKMDLRKGWATACLAREVVDDRAESKSAPMLRDIVRQAPVPEGFEYWDTRLRLVSSLAEGSKVMSSAKEDSTVSGIEWEALLNHAEQRAEDLASRQLTS